jgi:hypothetical protein
MVRVDVQLRPRDRSGQRIALAVNHDRPAAAAAIDARRPWRASAALDAAPGARQLTAWPASR